MSALRTRILDALTCPECGSVGFRACGEPRRRVEGKAEYVNSRTGGDVTTLHFRAGEHITGAGNTVDSAGQGDRAATRVAPTLGWTDCGCGAEFVPGTVLDPFGGTGTTGAVAALHGRDAILIDIDERNRDMYPARLDECRKALFGTAPELPGQLDMFGEVVR